MANHFVFILSICVCVFKCNFSLFLPKKWNLLHKLFYNFLFTQYVACFKTLTLTPNKPRSLSYVLFSTAVDVTFYFFNELN